MMSKIIIALHHPAHHQYNDSHHHPTKIFIKTGAKLWLVRAPLLECRGNALLWGQSGNMTFLGHVHKFFSLHDASCISCQVPNRQQWEIRKHDFLGSRAQVFDASYILHLLLCHLQAASWGNPVSDLCFCKSCFGCLDIDLRMFSAREGLQFQSQFAFLDLNRPFAI